MILGVVEKSRSRNHDKITLAAKITFGGKKQNKKTVDIPECITNLFRPREKKMKQSKGTSSKKETAPEFTSSSSSHSSSLPTNNNNSSNSDSNNNNSSTLPVQNDEVPFTVVMVGSIVRGKSNIKSKLKMIVDALHIHPIFGVTSEATDTELDQFIR